MDLKRLRIRHDAGPAKRGVGWVTPAVGVVCLAAGVLLSRLWGGGGMNAAVVDTMVARPYGNDAATRFTAGGWIEVAAPLHPVVVSARIAETLERLHVREGDVVAPGTVLAELYSVDVETRLALARAQEEQVAAEFARLSAGYREEDVRAAEAGVTDLTEALAFARGTLERSRGLLEGAVPLEQVEREAADVKVKTARLARGRAELEKLQAGYRTEDVAAAEAAFKEARVVREQAERDLGYCALRSPADLPELRVLKVHHPTGVRVAPGPGGDVVSLYDPTNIQVRVDVDQARIKGIRRGTPARIVTEADTSRRYSGRVLRVEPLADLAKNTISVRVVIEDPDLMLFPEMVARVTFLNEDIAVEDSGKLILVPRTAVIAEGDAAHVYIAQRGMAVGREVRLGGEREGMVEIVQGLHVGQRVILDATGLREGQPVRVK
jgi:RND family efflux transporter MFP subunit